MTTYIQTAHEESYSNGRTLGVLLNYDEDGKRVDSFTYIFRYEDTAQKNGMYIFFNTIIDMNDYFLYGDKRVKRAYMKENVFDDIFDADYIDGDFNAYLEWMG